MAKKMRKLLVLCMVLALSISMMAMPVMAKGPGGNRPGGGGWGPGGGSSSEYEWYQIYVQNNLVASASGTPGDVLWLGITYSASASIKGTTLTWYIKTNSGTNGNYSGTVDLTNYITIPDGYEVKDINVTMTSSDVTGDNSVSDQYDNAIVKITITSFVNPETGETIPAPTEPEPEPTEPEPVDYEPVLSISKTADKASYEIGETIKWTITVTNTSEYTAYNVVITDDLTGDRWTIGTLAPGGVKAFTTTSEAAAAGSVENVAVVTWEDGDEIDDTEEPEETTTDSDNEIVEVTEPEPTEPDPTEPEPTEPEPTEPEPTEPEPTEPEPTEPEPTEPEPTEPDPTEPEPTEPEPTEPEPTEPEPTEPNNPGGYDPDPQDDDGLIDIPDEDVPLADVPKTGDSSLIWAAVSALSAGGMFGLNRKRKKE